MLGAPLNPPLGEATPAPASTHRVAGPEGKGLASGCRRGLDALGLEHSLAPGPASASPGGETRQRHLEAVVPGPGEGRSGTGRSRVRRAWIEGSRPRGGGRGRGSSGGHEIPNPGVGVEQARQSLQTL